MPGARPAFASAGAEYENTDLSATHQPTYPATVNAGDMAFAILSGFTGNANVGLALNSAAVTAGWVNVSGSPFVAADNVQALLVARRLCDGSEDGAAMEGGIDGSGGATQDFVHGYMFTVSAADGFNATPIEGVASSEEAASTTVNGPTVTPSAANRLAVSVIAFRNDLLSAPAFTGASATWTERVDHETTLQTDSTVQVQTAPADSEVSGGSMTIAASTARIRFSFAIAPADVGQTFTITSSLSALAQKQDILATTSLVALGQTSFSVQPTLEAAAQKLMTLISDLDAVSKKNLTAFSSLEAAGLGSLSNTATLDSLAQVIRDIEASFGALGAISEAIQTTLDAAAKDSFSAGSALDAAAQILGTIQLTLDSAAQKTFQIVSELDAVGITLGGFQILATLEALSKATLQLTTSLEALSSITVQLTASLEAAGQSSLSETTVLDSAASSAFQIQSLLDSAAQLQNIIATVSLTVAGQLVRSSVLDFNALSKKSLELDFLLDASGVISQAFLEQTAFRVYYD